MKKICIIILFLIVLFPLIARAEVEITTGAELGIGSFLSITKQTHNWLLFPFDVGYITKDGHWEYLAELYTGFQFHPNNAAIDGGALLLRYNFITKDYWRPFAEIGAGLVDTQIGKPDLGGHPLMADWIS